MALSIKDPVADRLARELARATGETITQAVTTAVEERLAHVRARRLGRRLADDLDEIAKRCAAMPVLDQRTPEETLEYDKHGLPH